MPAAASSACAMAPASDAPHRRYDWKLREVRRQWGLKVAVRVIPAFSFQGPEILFAAPLGFAPYAYVFLGGRKVIQNWLLHPFAQVLQEQ
jgi:hypothetical protein